MLLSSILVAHILGKTSYGEYSIIRTTIFMFLALATLGIGATTTKYISQYRNLDLQKAYNIYIVGSTFSVIFGLIVSLLIVVCANWIAVTQLNAASLTISIKYGAILLFFCTINGVQQGSLAGFEDFKIIARNSFITSIIEVIFICGMAYFWGINGALIGSALGYVAFTAMNHISIKKHFGDSLNGDIKKITKEDISVIWVFGVPSALCNLLVIVSLWMSRTYLIRETNFGEIAVYNAADQVKTFILFIPSALSTIILPILTNIKHTSKTKSAYVKVLKYNIGVNVAVASMLVLIVSICAKPILHLWGSDFNDTKTLIILSLSAIFSSFATVVGQAIASQGKMWIGFICNLIWATMVILLSRWFIGLGYGSTGLALAILTAYIVHGLYQYVVLRYFIRKSEF